MPNYTARQPSYAATWVDPDHYEATDALVASYLIPYTRSGATDRACVTCGRGSWEESLYVVARDGVDVHLGCFVGLCEQDGGGTNLLSLVPVPAPQMYDDDAHGITWD